jgi:hypothetical protein
MLLRLLALVRFPAAATWNEPVVIILSVLFFHFLFTYINKIHLLPFRPLEGLRTPPAGRWSVCGLTCAALDCSPAAATWNNQLSGTIF